MPEFVYPGQPARFTEHGKGTYILILRLVAPAAIKIGKVGSFHLDAGWYTYVGSAFGSGGLWGRLKHHLSPVKKAHWHIVYLRQRASAEEVWYVVSETIREHEWAEVLSLYVTRRCYRCSAFWRIRLSMQNASEPLRQRSRFLENG